QIRIRSGKISGTHLVAGENAIAKTGSGPLNLRFDLIGHVHATVERKVAISPQRMLTAWRPRFIEQTLLWNQPKRALGDLSAGHLAFRRRNFVNAPAQMNCSRATGSFGFPRHQLTQRIIDLENSRRVSKRFESAAILRRQLLTGDSQKFPNGKIEKNGAGFWQVVEIFDAMIYFDLAAEFAQITGERV